MNIDQWIGLIQQYAHPEELTVEMLNALIEKIVVHEKTVGEDAAENSVRVYDDAQILDLLCRTQGLERQKNILYGVALITLGIACSAMSGTVGGSDVRDFVSGILMGLSIVEILVGIWTIGKSS